jgi:hypothetical protein
MAIKKDDFNLYAKQRESTVLKSMIKKKTTYTHNRVFDNPPIAEAEINIKPQTLQDVGSTPTRTKGTQKGHKEGTKTKKIHKPTTKGTRWPRKQYTERHTNSTRNGTQIASLNQSLSLLTGLQRKIIISLYKSTRINGGRVTQPMSREHLANLANLNKNSVKTTIARLKKKLLITLHECKDGRGGWARYEISKDLYSDINHHHSLSVLDTNIEERAHKRYTEHDTEHDTTSLSSSSNINKSTTTNELPNEWKSINLDCLKQAFLITGLKAQFFGMSQLKTIYFSSENSLTANQVMESINHFSYGLINFSKEEPYSTMKNPGAILLKQLKNGDAWEEPKYLTESENALFEIYKNHSLIIEQEKNICFKSWLNTDRETKYAFYQSKISSTQFYDNKVFIEKAKKDFDENVWKSHKMEKALVILGEKNKNLLKRFEKIIAN